MASVEEEIARLAAEDGYYVVARTKRVVELERQNPWRTVFVTGLLSGGHHGLQRRERIYLWVDDDGEAVIQLHRPPEDA